MANYCQASSLAIPSLLQGLTNNWIDVRRILKTDSTFRDAAVDWESSQANADSGDQTTVISTRRKPSADRDTGLYRFGSARAEALHWAVKAPIIRLRSLPACSTLPK